MCIKRFRLTPPKIGVRLTYFFFFPKRKKKKHSIHKFSVGVCFFCPVGNKSTSIYGIMKYVAVAPSTLHAHARALALPLALPISSVIN